MTRQLCEKKYFYILFVTSDITIYDSRTEFSPILIFSKFFRWNANFNKKRSLDGMITLIKLFHHLLDGNGVY